VRRAGLPKAEPGADAGQRRRVGRRLDFIYGWIRRRIQIQPKIQAVRSPLLGKPKVLHTGHHNTAACDYSNRNADLGTQA